MRYITTVYGNQYIPFLQSHLQSVINIDPKAVITVYFEKVSVEEIKVLSMAYPQCTFVRGTQQITSNDLMKKIPMKLHYWVSASLTYPNDRLCLLDCDTLLVSKIDEFFSADSDVVYTWKNEHFPLNTGVILLNNTPRARVFMRKWLNTTLDILQNEAALKEAIDKNGAADQHALFQILQSPISFDGQHTISINSESVKFLGVNCELLNETRCRPISPQTHIIHYKTGWHPILLENRYSKERSESACKQMKDYWEDTYKQSQGLTIKDFVINAAYNYKERFATVIDNFEERGILNSEMLTVCSTCQALNIDIIIESGRYRGQSTEILAKYFSNTQVKVISVEFIRDAVARYAEKKLRAYQNLSLLYGNAHEILPKLIERYSKKKIAILLDGPKGIEAIDLFSSLSRRYPNVVLGFFHDMRKPSKDLPNPHRQYMEDTYSRVFFTDDKEYLNHFSYLDSLSNESQKRINEHTWRPFKKGKKISASYGPTLAAVFPTYLDRIKK